METTQTLSLKDFLYLLLATLAINSQRYNLKDRNNKIIALPVNYKQIIQNILCANNGWKDKFSILINIEEYFDDHFAWERELAKNLKNILKELNKSFEYDFEYDEILITFTEEEINMILKNYQNEKLKDTMSHFVNLLTDYIYTRDFQEKFHDYSANAVKKMNEIRNKEIYEGFLMDRPSVNLKRTLNIFNRK